MTGRLRWALLGVVGAIAVSVVVIALVVSGRGASTASTLPKGRLLAASANLFPQSILFGDTVHVQLDAVLDRRQLDPSRIAVQATWKPFAPVTPVVETRRDVGPFTLLRWRIELRCVTVSCLPQSGSIQRAVFSPTTLRYRGRARNGTTPEPVTVTWPQVNAVSRLDPTAGERRALILRGTGVPQRQAAAFGPPWHIDSTHLLPVTYAVSPTTLFWGSLALALVLLAATVLLLQPYLPALASLRRKRPQSPLERALAAVEAARGGEPSDERKALELLAEELRRSGRGGLAWAATELAWSPEQPEAQRTTELAASVRRSVLERTNGHRS